MAVQLSSTQRAVVAGVASAGLLIGAFTIGAGQTSASPAASGTAQAPVTAPSPAGARITVSGTGTVTGTPNQLLLSMGVQTSGASVGGALRSANHAVRAVTSALGRTGVKASDIQTSGLSIYPNYSSSSAPPSTYSVSESVQVTLRDLATAGTQINDAARAGGNATVIDGVSLNLTDTSTLLASARAKAVADAKAKASSYARALGAALGPVVSVSEPAPAQPFYPVALGNVPAASGKAASVPVHPGSQQVSVTVSVVFALG
jgi:uncharacterized protein